MINFFPGETETIVIPVEGNTIRRRILRELEKPFLGFTGRNLMGSLDEDGFVLGVQLRRPQMFMPVVTGNIEDTSKGSIIFLRYSLPGGTKFLMLFWALVLPLTTAFIAYHYKNYWILGGGIGALVFLFVIAWANFKLHVRTMRNLVLPIILGN